MIFEIDHVVFAASDLDDAREEFETRTGVRPRPGGPHVGMGTQNALASLGNGTYLELIAPDPDTAGPKNLGGALARLDATTLFAWALRRGDLPELVADLGQLGLETTRILEVSRETPDGERLSWDLMGLRDAGGAWPFFIDWRNAPHPSLDAPAAGERLRLEVSLPVDDVARIPFADVTGLTLTSGPPSMTAVFDTKTGEFRQSAENPAGFFR